MLSTYNNFNEKSFLYKDILIFIKKAYRFMHVINQIIFHRNPTPPVDYESIVDFKWLPIDNSQHLNYLDITEIGNFKQRADPEPERLRFWDWLYDNYTKP